jgi:hypothetical protein
MRTTLVTAAALASLVVCAPTARASIIFFDGPGAVQPEENLLFNGPGTVAGPGLEVRGRTNQTDTIFNLIGMENLVTPASGQARVEDESESGFTSLLVDALDPDVLYAEFEANLNAEGDGVANIQVVDNGGEVFNFELDLNGGGQNFFGLQAIDGQLINTVLITTAGVELHDVRQIRLGGITTDDGTGPDPAPEPTTMALLGLGLIGAGYARRRRQ